MPPRPLTPVSRNEYVAPDVSWPSAITVDAVAVDAAKSEDASAPVGETIVHAYEASVPLAHAVSP